MAYNILLDIYWMIYHISSIIHYLSRVRLHIIHYRLHITLFVFTSVRNNLAHPIANTYTTYYIIYVMNAIYDIGTKFLFLE